MKSGNSLTRDQIQRSRLRLLKMHFESGVGHIGGNLSALDILLSLHHEVLGPDDRFVLSKGHAAGALYITLWSMGSISEEELKTFHKDGTRLSGHPPARGIEQIPFATGSLGHGLGLAAGMALAKKLRGEGGRVFCLTSDGEWNEGSNWESLIFARHHVLDNLTVFVDLNGLQGFGTTEEVADLTPLSEKFQAFKVRTIEIDGHDPVEIRRAAAEAAGGLTFVLASTTKGSGVSFMEHKMEWHYLPLTPQLYQQAVEEIQRLCETPSANRS